MKYVFRDDVEVGPMKGSELPAEWAGAFVSVYIGADHIGVAVREAEASLLRDLYKTLHISSAYDLEIDDMNYDTDEEGYPGNEELKNIRATGSIFYGPFNGYTPEAHQLQ